MDALSNQDIIRILRKRQNCGFHEYTCGDEKCRAVLEPIERDGKVVLSCAACGNHVQDAPHVDPDFERQLDERRKVMGITD